MPTRTIASWDEGRGTAEIDFDVNNDITEFRIDNAAVSQAVWVQVEEIESGRSRDRTVEAGGTFQVSVPTGQGQRLRQCFDADRVLFDCLNIRVRYPA